MVTLLALATAIPIAGAQATRLVDPAERVYEDIDRLAAAGLIDSLIAGARPLSEREIRRLLREAQRNLGRNDRNARAREWAAEVIAADLARFGPRANRGIDELIAEYVQLDSRARPAPVDSNGKIDASINPLAANRQGRPLSRGGNATFETMHSAVIGDRFAIAVRPRGTVYGRQTAIGAQAASALVWWNGFLLEAGRDYTEWGQTAQGGLLVSRNAPALDMIRIANDGLIAIPGVRRVLGPMRGSAFIADLGASHQVHPHPQLIGWRLSTLPHRRLELGIEFVDEMGGQGGPEAKFTDRLQDLFPLIDAFRTSEFLFSNKMIGLDFRYRLPGLTGAELYGEAVLDDLDPRRWKSSFLEDGGYIGGVALHCLAECGRFGVTAEYHQTGIRFYTHNQFPSGITRNAVIIGDPLGPRGLGSYLTLDSDTRRNGRFAVSGAYEVQSGNMYEGLVNGPHDAGFHFVQVGHRPGEHRARGLLTWESAPRGRASASITAGAERVENFAFVAGNSRTNAMAQVRYDLRWW